MKEKYNIILVIFAFFILGLILTLQFKNEGEDYRFVSLRTITDLQAQINRELREIENLKELKSAKEAQLLEYSRAMSEEGTIKDVILNEIRSMKLISGFMDIEGPGITVKLQDSDRELFEGEDPNNIIIHEEDILMIVNELKVAGAEAISINGQRLMPNSEIKCSGPTITINGHTYGQPFIIKAIGEPSALDAAIKAQGSHSMFIRDFFGIIVESNVSPWIRIPKFLGEIVLEFAVPKEGERN